MHIDDVRRWAHRIVAGQPRRDQLTPVTWYDRAERELSFALNGPVSMTVAPMATDQGDAGHSLCFVALASSKMRDGFGLQSRDSAELFVCTPQSTLFTVSLPGLKLGEGLVVAGRAGVYIHGSLDFAAGQFRRTVPQSMSAIAPDATWTAVRDVMWTDGPFEARPVFVRSDGADNLLDDANEVLGRTTHRVVGEATVRGTTYVVVVVRSGGVHDLRIAAVEMTERAVLWHFLPGAIAVSGAAPGRSLGDWALAQHIAVTPVASGEGGRDTLTLCCWQGSAKACHGISFSPFEVTTAPSAALTSTRSLCAAAPVTFEVFSGVTPIVAVLAHGVLELRSLATHAGLAAHALPFDDPVDVVVRPGAALLSLVVTSQSSANFETSYRVLSGDPMSRSVSEIIIALHAPSVANEVVTALFFALPSVSSVTEALPHLLLSDGHLAGAAGGSAPNSVVPEQPVFDPLDVFALVSQIGVPESPITASALKHLAKRRKLIDLDRTAFALHLLHEACKLQRPLWQHLSALQELLLPLMEELHWTAYARYYANATGASVTLEPRDHDSFDLQRLEGAFEMDHFYADGTPPNIDNVLVSIVQSNGTVLPIPSEGGSFPLAAAMWPRVMQDLPQTHPLAVAGNLVSIYRVAAEPAPASEVSIAANIVHAVLGCHWPKAFVCDVLAIGVAYPIHLALATCRNHPSTEWSPEMLTLVGRPDVLRAGAMDRYAPCSTATDPLRAAVSAFGTERAGRSGGMALEDVESVLLPPHYAEHWNDTRAEVVQALLDTSKPISLPSSSDRSDAGQTVLKQLTKRALGLPVGRGMMSMATRDFRSRDVIPVPPLVLNGQTTDGLALTAEASTTGVESMLWPLFHNAVAAGLRFMPAAHEVQTLPRHWILHQIRTASSAVERAGLFLAAGLTKQLRSIEGVDVYSTLMSTAGSAAVREPVTVGVTLGLAVSYRASCAPDVLNYVQHHLQSLQQNAADLDSTLTSQAAALVAMGLIHERSASPWVVEMLLTEMARVPTDEHCNQREGYKVAAGLALGLVLLGHGRGHGLGSLAIDDRLWAMVDGENQRVRRGHVPGRSDFEERGGAAEPDSLLMHLFHAVADEDALRNTSSNVLEGRDFDPHVTGPAATVALGLMYLQTGDHIVGRRLNVPDGTKALANVQPTSALLRTLCATLVVWPDTAPNRNWLFDCLPASLHRLFEDAAEVQPESIPHPERYALLVAGHALAGAILGLGLRYAGTLLIEAKTAILDELNGFLKGDIGTTGVQMNLLQKNTNAFEPCISACAVALALVMAGTADLDAFAVLRRLYKRHTPSYGEHTAVGMAIGLLFLSGGRCTLSNTRESIAALLCAVFPMWPSSSLDNAHHLQALRHLYVLATVPRWVEAVDVESGDTVGVEARLVLADCTGVVLDPVRGDGSVGKTWTPMPQGRGGHAIPIVTPCLLPDLSAVDRIEVRSVHHYALNVESFFDPSEQVKISVLRRPPSLIERATAGSTSVTRSRQQQGSSLEATWRDYVASLAAGGLSLPIAGALLSNLRLVEAACTAGLTVIERQTARGAVGGGRYSGGLHPTANAELPSLVGPEAISGVSHALAQRYRALLFDSRESVGAKGDTDGEIPLIVEFLQGATVSSVAEGCFEEEDVDYAKRWLVQALSHYGLTDVCRLKDALTAPPGTSDGANGSGRIGFYMGVHQAQLRTGLPMQVITSVATGLEGAGRRHR